METKTITTIQLSSSGFERNGTILKKYTCDGMNVNPPLTIEGIPKGTKSLALIVDDPDAPRGTWYHWIVWNIPPQKEIKENTIPGTEGLNDFGQHHYGGPCPPSGIHHYHFKLYALNTIMTIPDKSKKSALLKAMENHILAEGELIGLYTRKP